MINKMFVYFPLLHRFTVHPKVKDAKKEKEEYHLRATNMYLKNKKLKKELDDLKKLKSRMLQVLEEF